MARKDKEQTAKADEKSEEEAAVAEETSPDAVVLEAAPVALVEASAEEPLDIHTEVDGIALETLVFQEIRAINHYLDLGFNLYFWRTADNKEVDFVLYGDKGLIAIEVKLSATFRESELESLRLFCRDYPMAKAYFIYGGDRRIRYENIDVIPLEQFLKCKWYSVNSEST